MPKVLEERLNDEYNRMLQRWEDGALYYHLVDYVRVLAKRSWTKQISKTTVCACLACSRLGIPINSRVISYLKHVKTVSVAGTLHTLASYKILIPVPPEKIVAHYMRIYKLHPDFIKHTYTKILELMKEEET